MPTNRSFLPNFLAAFRAHSSLQNGAVSKPPSQGGASSTSHIYPNTNSSSPSTATTTNAAGASSPRAINPASGKPTHSSTTVAVQQAAAGQFHASRHHTHHPPSYPRSPQSPQSFPPLGSRGRSVRRDSDSSTEGGFKDALGAGEKWYIGGRTPAGDERFYKLGMSKRPKSADRMSLDRMSL